MNAWYTAWLTTLVVEALVVWTSSNPLYARPITRRSIASIVILANLVTAIGVLSVDWKLWVLPSLIAIYRAVNVWRIAAYRFHIDRLWRQATGAFTWLSIFQLLCLGLVLFARQMGYEMLLALIVTLQLGTALVLLRSALFTWKHTKFPTDVPFLTNAELPSISVLVPARNETEALLTCLNSLVASTYPKMEIIVLDDCSTNPRTAEIIRDFAHDGVRFIRGVEPDARWLAKNYAYEQLVQESNGEYLVFCCADIELAPDALRRMISFAITEKRDMVSVLPQRQQEARRGLAILQSMRYYWELTFPRRFFKRPPVLSSSWLIRKEALESYGGFASAAHAITPEAHFAKKAVVANTYSFVRSNEDVIVFSNKSHDEQYATTVRMRYPQIHRRLELVCLVTLFQLTMFVAPFFMVLFAGFSSNPLLFIGVLSVTIASLTTTYYISSVLTRFSEPVVGIVAALPGFITDIIMLHISMVKYEFNDVYWKGRNICIPVMKVIPKLPSL